MLAAEDEYIRFKSITRNAMKICFIDDKEKYRYMFILRSQENLNHKLSLSTTKKEKEIYYSRVRLNKALTQFYAKTIGLEFSILDESNNEVLDKAVALYGKGEVINLSIKKVKAIKFGIDVKNIYVNEYANIITEFDNPRKINAYVVKEEI